MNAQLLLLTYRLAHQQGVTESVAYLRDRARSHVDAPGSAHRRSELRQAADVLDERIGRAEQRGRDLARTSLSPTYDQTEKRP